MKNLLLLLFISLTTFFSLQAQPDNAQENMRVSEVLNLIKGQWRQQYKIIDGNIVYDRRFLKTEEGMVLSVDTTTIHSFTIDDRGRTRYEINWEEVQGQMKFNDEESKGSWDLRQGTNGVDLIIRDAFYEGCPEVIRRVVRINERQLLLFDLQTGDRYYYTKRS